MQQCWTGFCTSVLGVTVDKWTKSSIRLNIAIGVICDTVTGLARFFFCFVLFSKYPNFSRYRRECNFIHNHMKSAPFLASNVVIVRNDNKFTFRSHMSNFAHIAQEMWEVFIELYSIVIKNGYEMRKVLVTSQKKARLFNIFLTHKC
jgi:hypothetical protein